MHEALSMRQEFQEAEEALEVAPAPAVVDPEVLAIADNFEVTKSKITAMKQACMGLTIAGIEDRKGYDLVHARRMEVRDARTGVDKIRKALKEGVLARGRKIDSVAKELTSLLVEIEEPLEAEEKRIDAEKERLKAERQREADAKLQKRIEALQAVGAPFVLSEITIATDAQFGFILASATEAFEAKEKLRLEAEAALARQQEESRQAAAKAQAEKEEAERIERAQVAKQAEENAKAAAALEAERAKLKADQDAFEAQKRAQEQAAREEQARKDGEAKAKAEAEREAAAEKARQEAEAKARLAAEAAKPDAEKIRALAKVIREIGLPKLSTDAGRATMTEIDASIGKFAKFIEGKADALSPIINPFAP